MQHSAAFKLRVRPPYPRSPRTHSLAAKLSFISRLAALAYVPSYFLSITKRVRCRMISQKINIKAKAEFNF